MYRYTTFARTFARTLAVGVSIHALNGGDYEYFAAKELERHEQNGTSKEKLDILHGDREQFIKEKLPRMSLSANQSLTSSTNKEELRLAVIGKTGQGKSATANTLLGEELFHTDYVSTSVTKKTLLRSATIGGREVSIFDTPGLQDTETSRKKTLEELARIFTHWEDGVHAFVYVINSAEPRFTDEDKEVLRLIKETFGGNFLNYCILVFTHGNDLTVDLDAWCTHQREVATEDVEKDEKPGEVLDTKGFAGLINTLSWRVVAIDNHLCSPYEEERHRNVIFAMVDKMRAKNNPPVYTHAFFKEAQAEKEKLRREALKEGWKSDEMEIVEEIIARNPDITRDELVKKLNEWLLKKNRELKSEQQVSKVQGRHKKFLSFLWGMIEDVFKKITGF